MSSMQIRALEPERDAHDVVGLMREASPTALIDERSWRHYEASIPARAQPGSWVAEVDGRVVGRAGAALNFFSKTTRRAFLGVTVRSEHRKRGIGRELYGAARSHADTLDVESLITMFYENPDGIAFARSRGFRETRSERESVVDPRSVTALPDENIDLRPVRDVDLRLVYRVDIESTLDVPSTDPIDDIPYEEWLRRVPENPLFTDEGSFMAFVGGEPAALTILLVEPVSQRGLNMFTGTLRAYRGRGLAYTVKLASLQWAREHGVVQVVTQNDERNAAMLAVNRRLGYRPAGRRVEYVLDL